MKKFKKILIVNRGEIAVRVIRACKELGIISAVVYSEADKSALHVQLADEAYYIGKAPATDSYLNAEKIISVAKENKVDAIHPGYGFMSENAAFIEAVENAGITFIGPSSKSVNMMGEKTTARQIMKKSSVPIVPGTTEPIDEVEEAVKIAKEIGFPVMLKASAGGGGKGMRKVDSEEGIASAFRAAKSEAAKAFGNDAVYIEKFIENPKHIEVQVISDKRGNYRHLFERECSVQRRHQKIVEEAPSAFVDAETRAKLTEAAINAAKAAEYANAGTIEFLMDKNKNFYFLEMNTRLQVEHPVTEMISGIDLVKEQISIAEGNEISFDQEDLAIKGHALETRIYAENIENNFTPSTGMIEYYSQPSGPGVRVDSGVASGSEVSIYYDPMLAKLITFGKNRTEVIDRMIRALKEYHIAGVLTNIPSLIWILKHPAFIDASFDINFMDKEFIPLLPDGWKEEESEDLETAIAALGIFLKNKENGLKASKNDVPSTNQWAVLYDE